MIAESKYKLFVWGFWTAIIAPIVFLFLLFWNISAGNLGFMPTFEELEDPRSNLASEIYSSDGKMVLGKYYTENRTIVHFKDVQQNLVEALIATEDVRFTEHSGIDARALGRVAFGLFTGNRKGGGSTISQQLAKNLFPRDTIRYTSKVAKAWAMVKIKFKEWVTAVKLERNYTKEEIIVMYLNTVEYGSGAFGIEAAARTFFGTVPDSLKTEEAALLVGVVNAPTRYSPVINPENSINRRNVVLAQMEKYGYISEEEFDSLKNLPIVLNYNVQSHNRGLSTYFREFLRTAMTAPEPKRENYASWQGQQFFEDSTAWANDPLYGWCNKNTKPDGSPYNLYRDGLKIFTTINSSMQRYAEEAVAEHMGKYLQPLFYEKSKENKNGPFSWRLTDQMVKDIIWTTIKRSERYRVLNLAEEKPDSAEVMANFKIPVSMKVFSWNGDIDTVMTPLDSLLYYKYVLRCGFMSMNPHTGHVVAYVGGINYQHFKYDHVKVAKRQVGSTFKPFIYTLAMQNGISPCEKVANIPYTIPMPEPQPPYTPQYSESRYDGQMITLKTGLALSLNQISAWVLKQYTPQAAVDLARNMGVLSHIDPVPAICVGSAEVTLAEMVGAYSTYANRGIYTQPIFVTRIEDKNGNLIVQFEPDSKEVLSEETAYMMLELMQGVTQAGTAVRLRTKYGLTTQIAGKTGTTNDNSDGWFMGITPDLVSGVWVGGEERSIRFNSTALGQGANMALPIWALYMQKVYADATIDLSRRPFDKPIYEFSVEVDCNKYEGDQPDGYDPLYDDEFFD